MKIDAYGEPMRQKSHRSYTPDYTRTVAVVLMPLLAANVILWKLYAQNGYVAAVWFIAFLGCIFYARKS
jgi:hypothetical protein